MGKAKKLGAAIVNEVGARLHGRRLPAEKRIARMQICEMCPERSDMWCGKCGCYLPAKARFVSEECPLGKWGPPEESGGSDRFD
jgi:hypothetical protein